MCVWNEGLMKLWIYERTGRCKGETSSRLNVMAGKPQLKAKMFFQSAIWWHYALTRYDLMKNILFKLGVHKIGDMW
jgi:hypothetical protein